MVGNYPYFDETLGKVVSFENAINACLRANGEPELAYGEREPMGVLTAYARTLSDGMRISIRVDSPRAAAKYEAGKNLFFRRIGQLNAACAGCHLYNAGKIMRMEIISPALGQATHWPIFRGGEELMTFQGRFKRCMEQMRAVPYGFDSDEWNNLEYFPHLSQQRVTTEVCGFSQVARTTTLTISSGVVGIPVSPLHLVAIALCRKLLQQLLIFGQRVYVGGQLRLLQRPPRHPPPSPASLPGCSAQHDHPFSALSCVGNTPPPQDIFLRRPQCRPAPLGSLGSVAVPLRPARPASWPELSHPYHSSSDNPKSHDPRLSEAVASA